MCTKLTPDWFSQYRKTLLTPEPTIQAYKIVRVLITGVTEIAFCSIYPQFQTFPFVWKNGINVSDRTSPELTQQEIRNQTVTQGFHCFMSLQDAERECNKHLECDNPYVGLKSYVVIQVTIKKEDIICFGEWDSTGIPCVVATQVETKLPTRIGLLKNPIEYRYDEKYRFDDYYQSYYKSYMKYNRNYNTIY